MSDTATATADTSTTTDTATTTTDASPAFTSALPEGWHTQLGDEFANHGETLQRFKGVDDLARSYIHARQMQPRYPGEDATPQDIQTWRDAAGVPESADGYQLAKPEDFPEELNWSDDRAKAMAELAHKHHVHPSFIKEAMALDTRLQTEAVASAKQEIEGQQAAAREALVKEWGGDFEANSSKVRHLTGRLAESAGVDPDQAAQLANSPAFAKVMLQVNRMISEDGTRLGSATVQDVRSPRERADAIMHGKDPEWSQRYRDNDEVAMKLVADLLTEAAQ